nr:MAG TPA: hypothetical protein [Caudoviricetes sp.]
MIIYPCQPQDKRHDFIAAVSLLLTLQFTDL